MCRLGAPQPNAAARSIPPDAPATVVNDQQYGSEALELVCKDPTGRVVNTLSWFLGSDLVAAWLDKLSHNEGV